MKASWVASFFTSVVCFIWWLNRKRRRENRGATRSQRGGDSGGDGDTSNFRSSWRRGSAICRSSARRQVGPTNNFTHVPRGAVGLIR